MSSIAILLSVIAVLYVGDFVRDNHKDTQEPPKIEQQK